MNATTTTETRALELLISGVSQENTALALGVTPSAISQLMADEKFAARVSEGRFKNLQKHNELDNKLDVLEDELVKKLADSLPLLMRPMDVARVLQVVNAAKRRGTSAPEQLTQAREVVSLTLPIQILNQYSPPQLQVTPNNQVVAAGDQQLITMQTSKLPAMLAAAKATAAEIAEHKKQLEAETLQNLRAQNGSPEPERTFISTGSKQKPVLDLDI